MKQYYFLFATIGVTITILFGNCDARSFRKHRVLAVAEGEKDVQPLSSNQTTSAVDNHEVQTDHRDSMAHIENHQDINRPTRSKPLPAAERLSCGSDALQNSNPEKKIETERQKSPFNLAVDKTSTNVKNVEESSGQNEPIRKIRKVYRTRRIQTQSSQTSEVDEKSLKVEPAKPVEVEAETSTLKPITGKEESPVEAENSKQSLSNPKKKTKKNSQKIATTTTTTTTTTAAPEEFSDETNEDDLNTSEIFPKQNDDNVSHDENKNSKTAAEPDVKAISANSQNVKALRKESSTVGNIESTKRKTVEGDLSDNNTRKHRRIYPGRRQGNQGSENKRQPIKISEENDDSDHA